MIKIKKKQTHQQTNKQTNKYFFRSKISQQNKVHSLQNIQKIFLVYPKMIQVKKPKTNKQTNKQNKYTSFEIGNILAKSSCIFTKLSESLPGGILR